MLGLLGFFEKKNRHDAESFEKAKKRRRAIEPKDPYHGFFDDYDSKQKERCLFNNRMR
jgi:hypothetical protein